MKPIVDCVQKSLRALKGEKKFKAWFKSANPEKGDIVLINNSFVFRQVKTIKNEQYLGFKLGRSKSTRGSPVVVTGLRMNKDIKLIRKGGTGNLTITSLQAAVKKEIGQIGALVFILIGRTDDNVKISARVNHHLLNKITLDPTQSKFIEIRGKEVTIKDTNDEERIWQKIIISLRSTKRADQDDAELRNAISVALDELEERAYVSLRLPSRKTQAQDTVVDAIVSMLRQQRNEYATALNLCGGDATKNAQAFNSILRIAYNFASDATTFIRLIVSVCDLKPVILWASICEHYRLSEAFRELPWQRLRYKPSLQNYRRTIADARNSVFHKLFPFRKTMQVKLPTSSLKDIHLRIFAKYRGKMTNELTYHDKELVDVLMEFTRAGEKLVAPRFWRQNLKVMDATLSLFEKTGEVLKNVRSLI